MTVLSRITKLGLAKETPLAQGTYVVPSISVPWNAAEYHDLKPPLRDESVRNNDSVVQGIVAGPQQTDWSLSTNQYADLIGHFFVSMGLFDTITTAGVSTTLASATTANVTTTLSLTATVPNNSILKLNDALGANVEYVQVGTVTGAGPFSAPITAAGGTGGNTTRFSHTTGSGNGIVTSQTTHSFKQAPYVRSLGASLSFSATLAAPAVFTATAHGYLANTPVQLTGASLPTGFTAATTYFVIPLTANTFSLAATPNGAGIASTGTGTGTVASQPFWPSYSFTTDDGITQLGWAGCVASELAVKIDPKALMNFAPKYTGWPSASQATFGYAASTTQPVQGWTWTVTNGGGSSTRGLTMDITFKRSGEAIHASTGAAGPREVFAGALEIDGTYKAIFDADTDRQLFLNYTQSPTVHTLTQPLLLGGSVLAITMSQSCYTDAKVINTQNYLQLDLPVTGIQNATDGGITGVTLSNFVTTAF